VACQPNLDGFLRISDVATIDESFIALGQAIT
jgi:hypothetical protein